MLFMKKQFYVIIIIIIIIIIDIYFIVHGMHNNLLRPIYIYIYIYILYIYILSGRFFLSFQSVSTLISPYFTSLFLFNN